MKKNCTHSGMNQALHLYHCTGWPRQTFGRCVYHEASPNDLATACAKTTDKDPERIALGYLMINEEVGFHQPHEHKCVYRVVNTVVTVVETPIAGD